MAHYRRMSCNIPPELLGRIFQVHATSTREPWISADDSITFPACSVGGGPYEWIRVTHVCRYWRDVALQAPLLWSHIVLTKNIECINAFLTRSHLAPLHVVQPRVRGGCFLESILPMASVRVVLAEMHRIRSLELYMKWWIFDDMAELLCGPAPALKSLKLSTPHGLYDSAFRKPMISFDRDDIKSLEKLTLGAYGFPWNDPAPFKSLKSLRIERGITEKPAVEQVVYALRFMPDLNTLSLDDVFAPSAKCLSSLPQAPDVVVLRHLEELNLSGDIVACSSLLAALIFPGSARTSLDFHRKGRNADLPLAMPSISARLTGSYPTGYDGTVPPPSPIVHVRLESSDYTYHLVCHTRSPPKVDDDSQLATMSIRVAAEQGSLGVLFRALPMQAVRVLELCGRTSWREVAPHAREVTELRLADWDAEDIRCLLLKGCNVGQRTPQIATDESKSTPSDIALPALRQLVVGPMTARTGVLGSKTDGMRAICDAADARNRFSSSSSSVAKLRKAKFEL